MNTCIIMLQRGEIYAKITVSAVHYKKEDIMNYFKKIALIVVGGGMLSLSLYGCAGTAVAEQPSHTPTTVVAELQSKTTPAPTPQPEPTPPPDPQDARVKGVATSTEQTVIKSGPAHTYDDIATIDASITVDVLDRTGSWYQVDSAGTQGWVEDDFLQVTLNEGVELPKIIIPDPNNFAELAPTTQMEFVELIADNGDYEYPLAFPEAGTYKVIVDIEHQVTMVYTQDENGEYTVPIRYMLSSTGDNDCTPKGTFEMGSYKVRFSEFVRDGRYGQYWTQIRDAIYFHTTLYLAKDDSDYEEASFNMLGEWDSHGCVRLTVPDAKWMWYNIAPTTICEIRDGDEDDTATAEIREQLLAGIPKAPEQHIDPDEMDVPYNDNWTVEDIPFETEFVQGAQNGPDSGKRVD